MVSADQLEWSFDGENIKSPDALASIEHALEQSGPLLIQHWYFYGASAPDFFVINNYEDFIEHLGSKAKPGDAIDVWDISKQCKFENRLAGGKLPDEKGRVPKGGAY